MGPSDISNLVRLVAGKKVNDGALWAAITRRVHFLKPVLSPKAIALISNGFARAQRRDFELFISLAEQSAQRLQHFEGHDTALFLNALARLELQYPRLMELFANHLLEKDSQLVYEEQHLALIVNAYAKLCPPGSFPALFAALGRRIQRQAAEFTPQGLANVINGYYRLGHRDDALMAALAPEVLRQAGRLEAQHVANILQGYAWHRTLIAPASSVAKARPSRHDEVLSGLANLLPRLQQRLGPVEAAACASAFATAALEERAAVKAISDVVADLHDAFRPDQLALTLYSLSKVKHVPPGKLRIGRLTPAISRRLGQFDEQSLVMLLHACSRARLPGRALFESLSERLEPGIAKLLPPQAVVMTLYALASVGLRSSLTEALLDRLALRSDAQASTHALAVRAGGTPLASQRAGNAVACAQLPASDHDGGSGESVPSCLAYSLTSPGASSSPAVSPGGDSGVPSEVAAPSRATPGTVCGVSACRPSAPLQLEKRETSFPHQPAGSEEPFPIAYAGSVMMSILKLDAGDRVDLLRIVSDAVCRATVGSLNPQQLANIAHCWAHLASSPSVREGAVASGSDDTRRRFLPPPVALDVVVAHALSQLDQFSPQLLGSLCLSLSALCRHVPAAKASTEKWFAAVHQARLPLALDRCSPHVVTTFFAASATLKRPPPPETLRLLVGKITLALHKLNAATFLQLLVSTTELLDGVVSQDLRSRQDGVLASCPILKIQESLLTDLLIALQEQLLSRVSCVDTPTLFASAQIIAGVPTLTLRHFAKRCGSAGELYTSRGGLTPAQPAALGGPRVSGATENACSSASFLSLRLFQPFDLLTPQSRLFLRTHAARLPAPCENAETLLEHWRQNLRHAPGTGAALAAFEGDGLCTSFGGRLDGAQADSVAAGDAASGVGSAAPSSQTKWALSLSAGGKEEREPRGENDLARKTAEEPSSLRAGETSELGTRGTGGPPTSPGPADSPRREHPSTALAGLGNAADFLVEEQKRWQVVEGEKENAETRTDSEDAPCISPRDVLGRLLRYSTTKKRLVDRGAGETETPDRPPVAGSPSTGAPGVAGTEAAIGFVSTVLETIVSTVRRHCSLFHPLLLAAATRAAGEANVQDPLFYAMAVARLSSLGLNNRAALTPSSGSLRSSEAEASLPAPAVVDFFDGLAAASYPLTGAEAGLLRLVWASLDGIATHPSLAARLLSALRRLEALEEPLLLRVFGSQVLLCQRRLAHLRASLVESSACADSAASAQSPRSETLSFALGPVINILATPVFTPTAARQLAQSISGSGGMRQIQPRHMRQGSQATLTAIPNGPDRSARNNALPAPTGFSPQSPSLLAQSPEDLHAEVNRGVVATAGGVYLWGIDFLSSLLVWVFRAHQERVVDVILDCGGTGVAKAAAPRSAADVGGHGSGFASENRPGGAVAPFPLPPEGVSPRAFSQECPSEASPCERLTTGLPQPGATPQSLPSISSSLASPQETPVPSVPSARPVRLLLPISAVADAMRAFASLPAAAVSPLTFHGVAACGELLALASSHACVSPSSSFDGSRSLCLSALCTGLRSLGQLVALPTVQSRSLKSTLEASDVARADPRGCAHRESPRGPDEAVIPRRDADLVCLVRAALVPSVNAPGRLEAKRDRERLLSVQSKILESLCVPTSFSWISDPRSGDDSRHSFEMPAHQKDTEKSFSGHAQTSGVHPLESAERSPGDCENSAEDWSRIEQDGIARLICAGDKLLVKTEELFNTSSGTRMTLTLADAISVAFWCCMRLLISSNAETQSRPQSANGDGEGIDTLSKRIQGSAAATDGAATSRRVLTKALVGLGAVVDGGKTGRRTQVLSPDERERVSLMIHGEDRRLLLIVHSFLRLDAPQLYAALPLHVRSILEAISTSGTCRHR
ncbi:hypothetical protein NCLIV_009680 [Neospora caninum Liverpool]|nr:hypothetical protein NCLIV_009680 [Neospora caninum Liverpool]CBZ50499.1 hypothetical protein NCLIV_009680 [Neospora caninum Liverpool]|eukprot:XP_003880532.1 hypothetical protein NCLIV_009680 [Neospora caninum Liverpool]